MEGVSGMEAAAARARVQAELEEAQQDLDDTVKDHIYEMQIQGLDDLMEDLNENFEDWSRLISQDLKEGQSAIAGAISNTGTKVSEAIYELLATFGISREDVEKKQYDVVPTTTRAKGVSKVKRKELAITNEPEYGREIIVTKHGVLTQLKPGDGVLPNKLTENFFEAAKNYPAMQDAINGLMMQRGLSNVSATPQVIQPNINCPITINGSNMSASEVQSILNSFIPKISQTVQNDIRKDLRKNGR